MSDKDLWEIPTFLWLSPQYKTQYPEIVQAAEAHKNAPLQNDRFFWGLVALGGITCKDFPEEENLFSIKYRLSKQRLIQNGRVVYSTDKIR